jgi:hypothetical protein
LGTPPAPIRPAKDSLVAGIAFVILLCAVVAAAFVFRGTIFKSVSFEPAPIKTNTVSNAVNNTPSAPPNPPPASPTVTLPTGDIALGKPALASSEESEKGNPIQNGNDGDTTTRWCAASGAVPQWWQVDLGSVATITNTQIMWERNAVYQYLIEVSTNQKNWTVVVDKTAKAAPAKTRSDNFSAKGRYVRIVITGLQEGSWASFYEFQVFGSSNSEK